MIKAKINSVMSTSSFFVRPAEGILFVLTGVLSMGLLASPYYAYAIIPPALLITLFLLSRAPHIGYYIIVFLIPFDIFRGLTDSYHFLTVSKLIGFWIFIVVIFYFLFRKLSFMDMKSSLWSLLTFFFIFSSLSAFFSEYMITALDNLRQLLTAYLFFALSLLFIRREDLIKTLPNVFIASVSLSALLSIIGYVFKLPNFVMYVEESSMVRGVGASLNPNHFAALIIFCLPLLAYRFFYSDNSRGKLAAFGLFAVNVVAIILTYSRGAAIVMLVVLLLLFIEFIRKLKPRYLGLLLSATGLLLLLMMLLVPSSYWARQKSVTDTSSTSIGRRITYLYVGWETFKDSPMMGIGLGAFKDVYGQSAYSLDYTNMPERFRRYAHNTYLEIITGTGIIGTIIYLSIIIVALKKFRDAKIYFQLNGMEKMSSLVKAYRLSFISLLVYFFMLSNVYHKYFWIALAVSQIFLTLSQKTEQDKNHGAVSIDH